MMSKKWWIVGIMIVIILIGFSILFFIKRANKLSDCQYEIDQCLELQSNGKNIECPMDDCSYYEGIFGISHHIKGI